uniref:Uncharacterized protein n=1 Tax=Saimiri boliviensis boliviensis TaxID=39432 RepID=A0A2K6UC65_SAIBB
EQHGCLFTCVQVGWECSSQTLSLVPSTPILSFVPFIPLRPVPFALWCLPAPHHLYPQGLGDHAAEAEKGKPEEGTQVALWLHVQPSCLSPVCLEPVPPRSRFPL